MDLSYRTFRTLLKIGKAFEKEHELIKGSGKGIFVQAHSKTIAELPWYTEEQNIPNPHGPQVEEMACLYFWKKTTHLVQLVRSSEETGLQSCGFGGEHSEKAFYQFLEYWRGLNPIGFDIRLLERLISDSRDIRSLISKYVSHWLFYVPDKNTFHMFCAPFLENDSVPEGKFFIKLIDESHPK